MKKQLHALTLMTVICGAAISTANAADGTINFTGEIIDAACTISPANANQTVKMGQISKSVFSGINDTAAATTFQIDLSACPANVANASVKFDGTPYEGDNTILALTPVDGAATGLGLSIRSDDGTNLPLFTPSNSTALTQGVTNSMKFSAAYVAKAAEVTPGPANAVATFTVIYN